MMEEKSWLVMADLQHSGKLEDKDAFRQKLLPVITLLNREFRQGLLQPLYHWKGIDELAFSVREAGVAVEIMVRLNWTLLPEQYRFVMIERENREPGNWALSVVNEGYEDIYETGASAMLHLKEEGHILLVSGTEKVLNGSLANQMNMFGYIIGGFSSRQQELWRHMVFAEAQAGQKDWAAAMSISQQAVSRMMHTMRATALLKLHRHMLQWTYQAYRGYRKNE